MLADMLNAPISKLSMSNNVDTGEHLINAGTLSIRQHELRVIIDRVSGTLSSSRQFSNTF